MAKRVVKFDMDIMFEVDDVYPEEPLENLIKEFCRNNGCKLLEFSFCADMTWKLEDGGYDDYVDGNNNLHFSPTPGKNIYFDDFTRNDEFGIFWSGICESCRKKYDIADNYIDRNSGDGSCGIVGCKNEADHYIDMPYTKCNGNIRKV